MNTKKRDFDKDAALWDENPGRVQLARDVANAISKQIALTPRTGVLDFGCGTGLLTLHLQPLVKSITGADTSHGMLNRLKAKLAKLKLNNVNVVLIDPDKHCNLAGSYDVVVSNMTLHHIKEIKPLLAQFHRLTAPGGHLCVADLDSDDGRFHEDNTGVFHFGFSRTALRKTFTEAGFSNLKVTTASEIEKPFKNGQMRRFTVFLMTGKNSN